MGGLARNRGLHLENLAVQAASRFGERLQRARERMGVLGSRLDGADPERILARGYSITTDRRQCVVRDAAALAADDEIRIRFSRGSATARVIKE